MKSFWLGMILPLALAACTGGATEPQPRTAEPSTPIASPSATPTPRLATPEPRQDAATPAGSVPLEKLAVEPAFPALSFLRMVALAYPDDRTDRLFLVLQPGRIVVFLNDPDVDSASTFLDIAGRVNDRGEEEGLLGLAFDPEFRSNGHFFVYYSASDPRRSVISRFSTIPDDPNAADPASERIVLEVSQPYSNHNGGQLVFGPDGYLYVGLGDGGSRDDPHDNGQNTGALLGTILRIGVSTLDSDGAYAVPADNPFVDRAGEAREEIWAYGLRNPWRFTFDRLTGELWAADVGQDRFEEIDIVTPGRNYGWNVMEGFHCFQPREDCDRAGLELPVVEYGRAEGCSVTGGYVYRGSRLPSLFGAYVYGDFCTGKVWGLRLDGPEVKEHLELVDSGLSISSFGEDQSGEIYILSFDGRIYRLARR